MSIDLRYCYSKKFAPPYACIFIGQLETKFLENQNLKPLVWFRYIDDIFFIWIFETLWLNLTYLVMTIKLTYECNKDTISPLNLKVILSNVNPQSL